MKIYDCPRCNKIIGQIVQIEGIDRLRINGVFCSRIVGNCTNCGHPIYYATADKFIEKLIQRGKIEQK